MKSRPNLGLAMLWLGLFLGLLSVLFLLQRILLIFSNLFIAMGFFFLMGSTKFFLFFKKKLKGTIFYALGLLLLMVRLHSPSLMVETGPQMVGLLVQMVGFYCLFEEFIPNLISYLRLTPFNKVLQAPGVKNCVGYLDRKNPRLPN